MTVQGVDLVVSHDDEARQQRLVGRGVTVDSDENLALIIGVQAGEDALSQAPPQFTPCCQGLPPRGLLQQSTYCRGELENLRPGEPTFG